MEEISSWRSRIGLGRCLPPINWLQPGTLSCLKKDDVGAAGVVSLDCEKGLSN